MKDAPLASVIIPTWNGRVLLAECLASLQAQSFQHFETIVVDNGSTDGTEEWLKAEYPDVCIVRLAANKGFAGGCNAGIAAATSEFVVLLNNDAVAEPEWLAALVNAAEQHPEAGFFASQIRRADAPDIIESLGDYYSVFGWAGHEGAGRKVSAVPPGVSESFGACACAVLYRTSALENVGLFDEEFFVSHEDVDLSFRLRLAGERCLCVHEAIVFHRGFATRKRDDPTTLFYSRRNQLYVLFKNLPLLLFVFLSPFLLLGQVLGLSSRVIHLGFWQALRTTLRARREALKQFPVFLEKRKKIQAGRKLSSLGLLRMLSWKI